MPPKKDYSFMVGWKVHELTIIGETIVSDSGRSRSAFACKCSCGTKAIVEAQKVISGHTKSCGCLLGKCRSRKYRGHASRTPEYSVFQGMMTRCYNAKSISYSRYGGRGISVADRWFGQCGFDNFLDDMGPRPSPDHSIERIDNDGDYCPENCRWATRDEQAANKRHVTGSRQRRVISHGGKSACLSEWARILGVSRKKIAYRLDQGVPFCEIVESYRMVGGVPRSDPGDSKK